MWLYGKSGSIYSTDIAMTRAADKTVLQVHQPRSDMAFSNKFSNIDVRAFMRFPWLQGVAATGRIPGQDAEQAYLAAALDHQDLERRLRVLDCRHGSVLHTLRVMKIGSY